MESFYGCLMVTMVGGKALAAHWLKEVVGPNFSLWLLLVVVANIDLPNRHPDPLENAVLRASMPPAAQNPMKSTRLT